MQKTTIGLAHQNFMLAVRREIGWPAFKPANDRIAFRSGRRMDFEVGSEMARIVQMLSKDAVYTAWTDTKATKPLGFTIVYRELLAIDIVDRVVPTLPTTMRRSYSSAPAPTNTSRSIDAARLCGFPASRGTSARVASWR